MRRLQTILLAACLIGLGCNSSGKKPSAPNSPTGRDGGDNSGAFWDEGDPPKRNRGNNAALEVDGVIAGKLIDNSGKPQPNAIVNVSLRDAVAGAKPIGVQADEQGYFTIKGLKSGATYFLSIRSEDGGRVLGGSATIEAPNTRLLVRLSEGNAPAAIPPTPGTALEKPKLSDPPASAAPGLDPVPAPKGPLTSGDQSWAPGGTPTPRPVAAPPPPPPSNTNIAGNEGAFPPTAAIPGPPPPASPSMSAVPSNSSPLLDTSIQERPPINFTVYDFAGEPIPFRKLSDRRLIVLDFWFTTCNPCIRKIPELVELQNRYHDYVDVVGIDCDNLPWAERTRAVQGIIAGFRRTRPINYKMYFEGSGQEGRLQNQFKVKAFPTLILLDYTGKQLWRCNNVKELEEAIAYSLNPRR